MVRRAVVLTRESRVCEHGTRCRRHRQARLNEACFSSAEADSGHAAASRVPSWRRRSDGSRKARNYV